MSTMPFCSGTVAEHHKFYKNNSGKAKITVTRTVAPATVDFNAAEGGQPQQRN